MQNALSVFLSTSFVAVLALAATPYTSPPNPGPEPPAAVAPVAQPLTQPLASPAQAQWQSDLLSAIGELNRKLDQSTPLQPSDANIDVGFDDGGSDGVSDNSTWPAPPVTPRSVGNGSTGGHPAGYGTTTRRIIRYSYPVGSSVVVSSGSNGGYVGNTGTSYGSTGGYSSSYPSTMSYAQPVGSFGTQRTGLFQRVRAARPLLRSPAGSFADCPGGVCNF